MKKKILLIMPSMFIGGAERSLLGLLEKIDYTKVDVSLFLYRHEGEFLQYIPKQVQILPEIESYRTFDTSIKSLLLSKYFLFGIARIVSKIALKLHCIASNEKQGVWMSMQYTAHFLQPLLPKIKGHYDLGIMYLGVAETLVNKVDATYKITWNHTDYDILYPNRKMDIKVYNEIDRIVSVSNSCTEKVKKFYPDLVDKAITIENILAENFIKQQSNVEQTEIKSEEGEYILLSIGRFSEAKNFDNIPDICKKILQNGLNIKWYLIGYGNDEKLIRDNIEKFDVQKQVIILGKRQNPYPYIKNCDLYVQPSRYEGKCVAVREAQILQKPVVITRYDTSGDQIEENVDGMIAPMDNQGCADAITKLLKKSDQILKFRENCSKRDYSNSAEVTKIYKILEEIS